MRKEPLFRKKGSLVLLLLFFIYVPFVAWAGQLPFAIVSDSHVGAPDSAYMDFLKRIEDENIRTIFHTGDATDRGTIRQWEEFLQLTGPGRTLHLAPGNHDIGDERSLQIYLRFFARMYYSVSYGDTLIVMLNSELPGQKNRITGAQLEWLKGELDKPFPYKFIFLHRPLFPVVRLRGLDKYEEERDRLHRLFVEKGISLVVSGHDHTFNRTVRDDVVYIIMPATRHRVMFPFDNGLPGYLVARRKGNNYLFTMKGMEGKMREEFQITLNNRQRAVTKLNFTNF